MSYNLVKSRFKKVRNDYTSKHGSVGSCRLGTSYYCADDENKKMFYSFVLVDSPDYVYEEYVYIRLFSKFKARVNWNLKVYQLEV